MHRICIVALVDGDQKGIENLLTPLVQEIETTKLQVVLVHRGSNQDVGEWQQQRFVSSCRSPRGIFGDMEARNAGLALASAPWVMFWDPTQPFPHDLVERVTAFLTHQDEQTLALLCMGPASDTEANAGSDGPSGAQGGLCSVDALDSVPDSDLCCIFRRDLMVSSKALVDSPVRPGFEETALRMRYLIAAAGLSVGWVEDGRIPLPLQAVRPEPAASIWADKSTYNDALEHSYLEPLEAAVRASGNAPRWLQNTVLRDLQWFFTVDSRERAPTVVVTETMAVAFHALVRRVVCAIDVDAIRSLDARRVVPEVQHALLSYRNPACCSAVSLTAYDHDQGLVRLVYYIHGDAPTELFLVDGEPVVPAFAKYRACRFFRRTLFRERIAWIPAADAEKFQAVLDGKPASVSLGYQPFSQATGGVAALRAVRMAYPPGREAQQEPTPQGARGLKTRFVQWLARHPRVRLKFARAWVFMDRETDADDNAEHLYRWVRRHHPEINAWFFLDPSSPQWRRLAREGFRLVPHGLRRKLLVLNSEHIVSSHADYAFGGLDSRLYGELMAWRFTFLQHGVAEKDVSHWFNDKPFDMLVTSSPAEHAAIVENDTPYTFTCRETKRTGLPRHDRLRELAAELSPSEVDTIVVLPTWRAGLLKSTGRSRSSIQEGIEGIRNSNYGRHWRALLGCDELRDLAVRHGKKVRFMPHPNLVRYIEAFDLPSHVEVVTKAGASIQELFCRSAVMITDFSSVAFEMAYLRRPVVYYQFDRDQFYSGDHNWREGYFDYDRDGFGPVAFEQSQVIAGLDSLLSSGGQTGGEYLARMEHALPERDGGACRRVFESILALRQPFKKSRTPICANLGSAKELLKDH